MVPKYQDFLHHYSIQWRSEGSNDVLDSNDFQCMEKRNSWNIQNILFLSHFFRLTVPLTMTLSSFIDPPSAIARTDHVQTFLKTLKWLKSRPEVVRLRILDYLHWLMAWSAAKISKIIKFRRKTGVCFSFAKYYSYSFQYLIIFEWLSLRKLLG